MGSKRGAAAPSEDSIERRRFAPVDGKTVSPADVDHTACEPAAVPVRDPLGCVLTALLVTVDPRRCQSEIAKVARKPAPGLDVPGAQTRESWASLAATMCSMSVSLVDAKQVPVYGPYTAPSSRTMSRSTNWGYG